MALVLHFHPLSSFCQKVVVALYEKGTAFTPHLVDLMTEGPRAAFYELWPIGKFPVLRDDERNLTVPESSVIIEYIDRLRPGGTKLIPDDFDAALRARQWDRVFDLYVNVPMQKIVGDRMRPQDKKDPFGVAEARALIQRALTVVERAVAAQPFAAGDAFTMADCAAAPALFYADMVAPFAETHPATAAYLQRLKERPSFARALEEAKPYLHLVPQ